MSEYGDWYTVAQVAERAGVARTTVIRDINKGKLDAKKVKVKLWDDRYDQDWYVIEPSVGDKYIQERKAKAEKRERIRQGAK